LCQTTGYWSELTEGKEGFEESTSRFEMNAVPFTRNKGSVLFLPNIRKNVESGKESNIVQLTWRWERTYCAFRAAAKPSTNLVVPSPVIRLAAQMRPPSQEAMGISLSPCWIWMEVVADKLGIKSILLMRK
jgi:hypothetical protein